MPTRLITAVAPSTAAATLSGRGQIGGDEGDLADPAQRLEEPGAARIALGDAQADPGLEQDFADVAADETAAAEDGDQAWGWVDHGGRSLAPSLPH